VWKVIGLSNGDIATACADGAARIFTRNHAKIADPEIVKDLDDLILAGKKKVSGVDPSSLPQAGILAQTKGKEDGEVKLVSSNGIPEAYSWSAAKGTWEKMGEVVDGPSMGSGFAGKTYYNGKMYDYVFDIELDTGMGMAKYKLPYNRGENPYEAAQNFIWKHNLSQFHLDQIAKFVINNSDYQGSMVTPQSMRGDPFTGHQREMGSSAPSQPKPTGNVELSGYAREQIAYQKELEERERQKKIQHIPSSYSPFDTANYPGISKKLSEFQTSVNMDSTSWKDLNQLIELLKVADLQKVEAKHIAALDAALKWPADKVFPVVDLARLVILTDAGANYFFQQYQTSKRNILTELLAVAFGESKNEALQMLTLRFLANMFQQAKLRFLAVSDSAEVLRKLSGACAGSTNANLKLAYATAVHNYAVYYTTYTQPNEAKEVILNIAKQGIPDESNQDIVYRFICGAGTLVNQGGDVVEQAKKTGLKEVFGQKISSPNAKVAAAAFQAFQLVRD
jgi:phospholipase A-2-activating protein